MDGFWSDVSERRNIGTTALAVEYTQFVIFFYHWDKYRGHPMSHHLSSASVSGAGQSTDPIWYQCVQTFHFFFSLLNDCRDA